MKQLVQNYRTGELKLVEVPAPQAGAGGMLVRNVNSVVSVGTEKLMMEFAGKSLLGKALARPDLTRQVIDYARNEGLMKAYQQATSRLDNLTPLGYSSAGMVMEAGEGIDDFQAGDRVACSRGGFASHAEFIRVPRNLCARIPDNVDFESAAFTTVGAISLHAIRLCQLGPGDRIAFIGLGLLGLLGTQIAAASGYSVFGLDSDGRKVELAEQLGAGGTAVAGRDDVAGLAEGFTGGAGFDAVVILASTSSNEPLETAARICRPKGKIVVPGMVRLDVPRETFYQKELSLTVSKGWGPGFDDPLYELKGVDYPPDYVRWTEQRNMAQFLEMLSEGRIQIAPLISHRFKIDEAESAYKSIMEDKSGSYIGVLLEYDSKAAEPPARKIELKKQPQAGQPQDKIRVGLIGAGQFATGTMLPIIKKIPAVQLRGIATNTGVTGKHAGSKFGFDYCTTDYRELLNDPDINCILIATRHDLHAGLVVEALENNKDVFVEKPLALSSDELREIIGACEANPKRLMVGFNRRFSPFTRKAKELLENINEPLVINCRVNAGSLPKDSWVHDPSQGGGRILGEICHFVDLAQFLSGSLPAKVKAESLRDTGVYNPDENVVVTITMKNGSLATITYVANGDKSFPRERVEIFGGGSACVIDNFKSMLFTRGSKRKKMRKFNKDSGHGAEFSAFFSAIQGNLQMPVDFEEYVYTTLGTLGIERSLREGRPVDIDPDKDFSNLK
ncbi:MAG: bi-domain-containing oxidoreductase [Dehalococcoidia bacterium]